MENGNKPKKTIGYLGLGKMGLNMALRLKEQGYEVIGWNRSEEGRKHAQNAGFEVFDTLGGLVNRLPLPRIVWLMVPSNAVDQMLASLVQCLDKGDTIIDGGNTYFGDTVTRSSLLKLRGLHFIDAGVSGGPGGARTGACVMVGGENDVVEKQEDIFRAIAAPGAYAHVGRAGAGHFVKMVHNGIEYGMMQALAEGFSTLKASPFNLDLKEVAHLYNNKSVIESRLVGWLEDAYEKFGVDLDDVTSTVAHTGEGEWTFKYARKMKIETPVLKQSLVFRKKSGDKPSYTGKVLSALRNSFGGHSVDGGIAKK